MSRVKKINEGGIYCISMADKDITLTASRLYQVAIGSSDYCGISVVTEGTNCDYVVDDETEQTYYYTPDTVIFTVEVCEDYNTEDMTVTLTGEDGTEYVLTKPINPEINENGCLVYTFESDTLTQDVTISVTGLYSNGTRSLSLFYDKNELQGIDIQITNDAGERIDPEEDSYQIHEGKTYNLVMTTKNMRPSIQRVKLRH